MDPKIPPFQSGNNRDTAKKEIEKNKKN